MQSPDKALPAHYRKHERGELEPLLPTPGISAGEDPDPGTRDVENRLSEHRQWKRRQGMKKR